MGRLIGTTTQYAFLPSSPFSNAYAYDTASNRKSLTAPDGSIATYGYDTLNRLNGMANSWAGSFGFSSDALSRRTQLTRPNAGPDPHHPNGLWTLAFGDSAVLNAWDDPSRDFHGNVYYSNSDAIVHSAKHFPHGFRSRAQFLFRHYFTHFV